MNKYVLKIVDWLKSNLTNISVLIIIVIGIWFRTNFYDELQYSIGTNDSLSYYSQADIPLFSWEAFTSRRLPTYPVFFKIFEPEDGYHKPDAISYPAAPGVGTKHKAIQPEYIKIVVVQAYLAILAWVSLVIVICRHLKTKILRPIAAAIILAFAFSPALVEWDSILMTESLSFSLFTLLAAVTLELLNRVSKEKKNPGIITKGLFIAWALLIPAWAYTRDSNSNTLLVVVVFFLIFFSIPKIRQNIPVAWISGLLVWTAFLAIWYSVTTFAANRWTWGWFDIYNDWVSGYPERVKFFESWGMPTPWTKEWVQQSGSKAYLSFLFNNPGFMVSELLGRLSDAFSENIQPYFFTPPSMIRKMIVAIGDIFHPYSSVAFFFPIFSCLLIIVAAIRNSIMENKTWFIFSLWLLCMIYGLYLASFYGDSAGLIRHTLGAVVYMRFMIWLFPIILAEIVSKPKEIKKTTD
jgi:hypothetical protein